MKVMRDVTFALIAVILNAPFAQAQSNDLESPKMMENLPKTAVKVPDGLEVATLGSGCFWCIEAFFQELEGVSQVKSGYSGGFIENPSYRQVTSGTSGHAEVIQFFFDPKIISFQEILEVFWATHDPTTLNRQGADVGPQYRSAVFYHDEEQKKVAIYFKEKLDGSGAFENPIVTEITPFSNFYVAENYHQNYFQANGSAPYCQYVIRPKYEKFQKVFGEKLKKP